MSTVTDPPPLTVDILGWPPDGPTLRLHHDRFSYAGKFVMSNTGKAVARVAEDADVAPENGEVDANAAEARPYDTDVVGALAFNEDRTDSSTLWLRYVTVDRRYRGHGIGPRLVVVVREAALERGYDRLRIAVNNPYAYDALWKAGFGFTGEETGIAELVLEHPIDADERVYRRGLEGFLERELTEGERSFIRRRLSTGPPRSFVGDGSDARSDSR